MYFYSLFGYNIESDLEFPQLLKGVARKADITISQGEIPDEVYVREAEKLYEFGEKSSWLINDTCYLYITDGNKITYKPKEGAITNRLRNYIMGWGMSMLGLQREIIAMHCSVVTRQSGAILVSGESGTGKSTLTNILLDKGCKFMADDMAYVEPKESGEVYVKPAFPYQKLCRDAALRKGYPLEELIYINEMKDKFFVPYKGEFEAKEVPVKALLVLKLTDKPNVNVMELQGMEKFMACANNQFLRHLLKQDKYKGSAGKNCFKIAQGIRVFVMERPKEGDTLAEITKRAMNIVEEVL